jgi:hypothetical protein
MSEEDGKPYHDPVTGLFTYPAPKTTNQTDFREHPVEMPTGEKKNILIPPAELKPSRVFFAAVNGVSQTWSVEETVDEIKAAIEDARSETHTDWYKFTDPIFGRDLHVSYVSLQACTGIMEDMTDLQKMRDNIAKEQFEKDEFRKFALAQTASKSNVRLH